MVIPIILLGFFWISLGALGINQLKKEGDAMSKVDFWGCIVLIATGLIFSLIGFFGLISSNSVGLAIIIFIISLIAFKSVVGPYRISRRKDH